MPGTVFDPLLRGRFNTADRSGWQRNGDLLNHDRDVLLPSHQTQTLIDHILTTKLHRQSQAQSRDGIEPAYYELHILRWPCDQQLYNLALLDFVESLFSVLEWDCLRDQSLDINSTSCYHSQSSVIVLRSVPNEPRIVSSFVQASTIEKGISA